MKHLFTVKVHIGLSLLNKVIILYVNLKNHAKHQAVFTWHPHFSLHFIENIELLVVYSREAPMGNNQISDDALWHYDSVAHLKKQPHFSKMEDPGSGLLPPWSVLRPTATLGNIVRLHCQSCDWKALSQSFLYKKSTCWLHFTSGDTVANKLDSILKCRYYRQHCTSNLGTTTCP